jgi:acyl transferase domain-containing protein
LTRDRQDVAHILETLAAAYARGVPFKMDELFSEAGCRRTVLPLYPFRRDRHWLGIEQHSDYDPASAAGNGARDLSDASTHVVAVSPPSELVIPAVLHPLLGRVVSRATHRATFETDLAASQPWVDHRILGATVFPGAAYLEMAVRGFAASRGLDWMATQLHDVGFERPLVLGYGKSVKVTLNLETRPTNGKAESNFVIGAVGDGNAGPYCRGRVSRAGNDAEKVSVHDLLARINAKQQIGAFYGELRKLGFEYGAGFSTIRDLWLGGPGSGEAIARVTASPRTNGAELHPFVYSTVLDGSLQVFGAAMRTLATSDRPGTFVPRSIKRIALRNLPAPEVWSHATVRVTGDGRSLLARIRVMTEAGDIVADIDDMELRPVGKLTLSRGQTGQHADPERVSETREQIFERLQPMPRRARVAALSDWLVAEVKDILGGAAEEIDLDNLEPSTALLEIGLDSLLVTELQRRIQEKLEFRFKAMQGLDYQTIETLAEFLLDEVLFAAAPPASAKPAEVNRQIDN